MSSLYQRGKNWYLIWSESGRQRRKSLHTDNDDLAKIMKNEEDRKKLLAPYGINTSRTRWARFKEDYLKYSKSRKDKKTWAKDVLVLDRFQKDCSPDFIDVITPSAIDKWISSIADDTSKPNANAYYRHLKAAINKAIEWGSLTASPFRGVKQFRLEKKSPRFLSTEEKNKLLEAAKQDRPDAHLMAMIFLYTGVRVSELCALRWEDFDLARGWLKVRAEVAKGGKERAIPINDDLMAVVAPLKKAGFIFKASGRPISRFTVADVFSRLFARAAVKDANVHVLRHTFASHCVMSGIDLPTLQGYLGHSTITTTMIYAHLSRPHAKESIKKFRYL